MTTISLHEQARALPDVTSYQGMKRKRKDAEYSITRDVADVINERIAAAIQVGSEVKPSVIADRFFGIAMPDELPDGELNNISELDLDLIGYSQLSYSDSIILYRHGITKVKHLLMLDTGAFYILDFTNPAETVIVLQSILDYTGEIAGKTFTIGMLAGK